jgi:UDP-N-acetylglucosamine 2-epimerase (non-hydrolysing)
VMRAMGGIGDLHQVLVHTGQHYDSSMSDAFLADLDLPAPDHHLGVGPGSHTEQTARVMVSLEPVLIEESPGVVVVPGDVNSTLAAALTSAQMGIPVAHLEAGLRSWDRTMPEEHNRVLTDQLAELLLTPTRDADRNLQAEGVDDRRIAFVGNTMIDSLLTYATTARQLDVAGELGVDGFVLVTLHRPGLVDRPDRFRSVLEALERVAEERPVVYPMHPRSQKRLGEIGWRSRRVRLLPPQSYLRFLSLMTAAEAVVTDSGGIQEETTVLGIPCFTLRANTERPITVELGTNTVLGVGDSALEKLPRVLRERQPSRAVQPDGWDGKAAERAGHAILSRFAS